MDKVNIFDIKGTEYPAGRCTRVIIGDNGAISGEYFCQGYVVIYPQGSIPQHQHPTVENYVILKGTGVVTVGEETETVGEYDSVYIPANVSHRLQNIGTEDMHLMFTYAPKIIVDHWAQELSGELK